MVFLALPIVSLSVVFFAYSTPVSAIQTVPYKMNFQGRLSDASGNAMPNGTYNMKFRIYDALTGGTQQWTEQRANSATTGVTVTNGLFSVQLGDVTGLPPAIFTNQNLYFEIELPTPATATCSTGSCESYTEGPMGPRNKLGTSAYAFNSDTLDGLDSTAFALASGSANYIQNGSSPQSANFNITGTGMATTLQSATFDAASSGTLSIGTVNATSIMLAQSTTVGAGMSLTLVGGTTGTRPASPTKGVLYYDTTTSQVLQYNGTKWVGSQKQAVLVAAGSSSQADKDASDFVGDGTNDQNAINAAISSLPASGGIVQLLKGTYNITAPVIVSADVTVAGQSRGTTLKRMYDGGTNDGIVTIMGSGVAVQSLAIDGNKSTYTNANNNGIIASSLRTNVTIQNTTITNSAGSGIVTAWNILGGNGYGTWKVTGNTVSSNTASGITLDRTAGLVSSNTVDSNGGTGISIVGCGSTPDRPTITGNTVNSNNIGIVTSCDYAIISSNTIANTTSVSINSSAIGVLLTNNAIKSSGGDAIDSYGAQAVVSSNTISMSASTAASLRGIHLRGGVANDNYVDMTNASGPSTAGVYLFSGPSAASGNHIVTPAAGRGIDVGNASNSQVSDNTIVPASNVTSFTAITISVNSTRVYLSNNSHSFGTISDSGIGTIWASQTDNNDNLINKGVGGMTIGAGAVTATLSLQGGMNVTQLAPPATPTVANGGTAGTTSYSYAITALDGTGETLASTTGSTTTGNATLNATNYNTVTWTEISGATSYRIYRTASAGSPATTGLIGTVTAVAGATGSFSDTGIAATTAVPTMNTTGGIQAAGNITTNGTVLFKNSVDSATALQLQNATGSTLLSVNTTSASGQILTVSGAANAGALYVNQRFDQLGGSPNGGGIYFINGTGSAYVRGVYYDHNSNHMVMGATTDILGNLNIAATSGTGIISAKVGAAAVFQVNDFTAGPAVNVFTTASGQIGTVIQGSFGQVGDLLQLRNSSGNKLTSFNANGDLAIGGANSAASANALQIQNTVGTSLFTADTSGMNITVAGTATSFATFALTNAHFSATQTTAPTIGVTTCTTSANGVTTGSTDSAGSFSLTASSAATCTATLTFNKAYTTAPKSIIITPANAGASEIQAYVSSSTATTFVVTFNIAATASKAYSFNYWVVQ